jgi:uncharacterized membrane protein
MPKKFDTNPLDPEFPEKVMEAQKTTTLPSNSPETAKFPAAAAVTEEQTRRFNEQPDFQAYQSPYNGQQIPMNYQAPQLADMNRSSSRKVAKVGLPENILTAVSYIPFLIGLVAGVLQLLFVPKSETKVRFHAAQGLAAHLAILIITSIMGGIGEAVGIARVGNIIFTVVTTVMLIIFALKAYKGKPVHVESLDDLTNWLEERIKPKD